MLTHFVFQIPLNQRKWTESWFVSFLWRCLLPQWLTRWHQRKRSNDNGAGENEILRFVNRDLNCSKLPYVLSAAGPHDAGGTKKRSFLSEDAANSMFSVYITPKTQQSFCWGLCLRKTCSEKSHNNHDAVIDHFMKSPVFKTFSVLVKTKSRRFQISPVCRGFSKASFSWQICHVSVDGRPNRRGEKLCFQNLQRNVKAALVSVRLKNNVLHDRALSRCEWQENYYLSSERN